VVILDTASKLLVLTDEIFSDAISGVGKSLYNEAIAWVRHGHMVTVIVRGINAALPPFEVIDGIHIYRVQGIISPSPFYCFFPLVIFGKVITRLRNLDQSFDVVVAHNPIFLLAAQVAGIMHARLSVYIFHSSTAQEIMLNLRRGKYGLLMPLLWVAAQGLRRVDVIIARSRFMENNLQTLMQGLPFQSEIIPIGLNTAHYQPVDAADART